MGLFVSCAFCGLCGFCARVELGGYMTCGVFAFIFHLLCPCLVLLILCLPPFMLVVLLCSGCLLLVLLPCLVFLCGLLFLFPFRYMRKKKGRKSLRPRFVCCGLLCCRYLDLFSSSVDCISCRYFVMSADYFAKCVNPVGSVRN